jgi:hypothetical protein
VAPQTRHAGAEPGRLRALLLVTSRGVSEAPMGYAWRPRPNTKRSSSAIAKGAAENRSPVHGPHRMSPSLLARAPLPYVMDEVGHADSKTTLEIYAQVQKRASRRSVQRRVRPIAQRRGQQHRPCPLLNIALSAANVALWRPSLPCSRGRGGPAGPRSGPRRPPTHGRGTSIRQEIPADRYGHGWARTSDLSRVKRALSH